MRQEIFKPTQKDLSKAKDRQTGTGQGCAGTSNPGVNWKPENLLKGIQNLAPNITQS